MQVLIQEVWDGALDYIFNKLLVLQCCWSMDYILGSKDL